jgi:hypothetical protein
MLKNRIDSAITDPRYRFMFGSRMIEDTIHQTISHIFRVEDAMLPITCFEMAGMPSEVVNAVCSVLARLAFDLTLWSEKRFKILLMCEEAHRYLPTDSRLGFAPTKEALSRIAKEGRKYGCYLGVITQRPGELDPTILSQCSTIFAMRLANEQDQAIIRSAIADSSASSLSFLSSMGQREAIAFGEGVATTMRLKFETLPLSRIPGLGKEHNADAHGDPSARLDVHEIVERMRNSQIRQIVATPEPEPVQQHSTLNSLLRRPIKPTLSDDDPNFGYGLRSGAFGSKTARSDFPLGLSAQLFRILRETRQAGLSKSGLRPCGLGADTIPALPLRFVEAQIGPAIKFIHRLTAIPNRDPYACRDFEPNIAGSDCLRGYRFSDSLRKARQHFKSMLGATMANSSPPSRATMS